jgi:hypothetical protein
LSQENLRFLSCHGQMKCKWNPPMEPNFPAPSGGDGCCRVARSKMGAHGW